MSDLPPLPSYDVEPMLPLPVGMDEVTLLRAEAAQIDRHALAGPDLEQRETVAPHLGRLMHAREDAPEASEAAPRMPKMPGRISRTLGALSINKLRDRAYDKDAGVRQKQASRKTELAVRAARESRERARRAALQPDGGTPTRRSTSRNPRVQDPARRLEEDAARSIVSFINDSQRPRMAKSADKRINAASSAQAARLDAVKQPVEPRFRSDTLDQATRDGDMSGYRRELRKLAGESGAVSGNDILRARTGRDKDQERQDEALARLAALRAREEARAARQQQRSGQKGQPRDVAGRTASNDENHDEISVDLEREIIPGIKEADLHVVDLTIRDVIKENVRRAKALQGIVGDLPRDEFELIRDVTREDVMWNFIEDKNLSDDEIRLIRNRLREIIEERH